MAGPFRISKARAVKIDAAGGSDLQEYLQRLMKMIPADVVGLYLVGTGLINAQAAGLLAFWTSVCAVGVIVERALGSKDPASGAHPGPDWILVLISTIAFLIWVYDVGGAFAAYGIPNRPYGALAVLGWTFFVPYFYKGI